MQYTGNLASAMLFTFPLGALSRFSGACVLLTVPPLALPSLPVCSGSSALHTWSHWCASALHSYSIPLRTPRTPSTSLLLPFVFGVLPAGAVTTPPQAVPLVTGRALPLAPSAMHHLSACSSHRNARAAWSFPWHLLARCPCAGSAQLSRSTFLPCFLTSFCDSSFDGLASSRSCRGSEASKFSELSQVPAAPLFVCFTSMA